MILDGPFLESGDVADVHRARFHDVSRVGFGRQSSLVVPRAALLEESSLATPLHAGPQTSDFALPLTVNGLRVREIDFASRQHGPA